MKKIISFIAVMTAIIFFVGCNNQPKAVQISSPELHYAGKDTTMVDSCQSFVLKNWKGKNSCGKFVSGTHWVPAGYNVVTHTVTQQGKIVSDNNLKRLTPPVSFDFSFNWMPNWLKYLLILLGSYCWLYGIYSLFTKASRELYAMNASTSTATRESNIETTSIKESFSASEVSELTTLITVIGQAGGGSVKTDNLDIKINGVQSPLVHIGKVVFKTDYKKKDEEDTTDKEKK